jgi:hypothetical protein
MNSIFTWLVSCLSLVECPHHHCELGGQQRQQMDRAAGWGVGKLFKLDKLPINTQLQAFYNVERPDFEADW